MRWTWQLGVLQWGGVEAATEPCGMRVVSSWDGLVWGGGW